MDEEMSMEAAIRTKVTAYPSNQLNRPSAGRGPNVASRSKLMFPNPKR